MSEQLPLVEAVRRSLLAEVNGGENEPITSLFKPEVWELVLSTNLARYGYQLAAITDVVNLTARAAEAERLADWVRQYHAEFDATRLGPAAVDLNLRASIRQAMFDAADAFLQRLADR